MPVLLLHISHNSYGKEELILWWSLRVKLKVILVPLKVLSYKQKIFFKWPAQAKGELLEYVMSSESMDQASELQRARTVIK